MGFDISQNANLVFEAGTRLAGAHVKVSLDMDIREYAALMRSARRWTDRDEDELGDEDLAQLQELLSSFGDNVLVEWDLERNGAPIPPSGEGMTRLPLPAAMAIFKAWSSVVSEPPPNSDGASANGGQSGAPSDETGQS